MYKLFVCDYVFNDKNICWKAKLKGLIYIFKSLVSFRFGFGARM